MKINTHEIRKSAASLQRCANKVQSVLLSQVKNASSKAEDASQSEAEAAIQERLTGIRTDLDKAYRHLSTTAAHMYRYADLLDEADRAAQAAVNGH
ncbi:MAG: hypothetical protein IKQ41_07370 [Clostridia bacterium]|nr:hypothetical protein [Clostridia bacterium]